MDVVKLLKFKCTSLRSYFEDYIHRNKNCFQMSTSSTSKILATPLLPQQKLDIIYEWPIPSKKEANLFTLIIFYYTCGKNVFRLMFLTPVGFSGWTMVTCLIIMWIFSSRQMRNYFYNSFMGIHYIFFLFFIMLYYHPLRYVQYV